MSCWHLPAPFARRLVECATGACCYSWLLQLDRLDDERRAHRHNSLPAEQTLVRGRVQDPANVEVASLADLAEYR